MNTIPKAVALEMETARIVEGYFYLENGYYMINGVPDYNHPVERYYIVDDDGGHREVAPSTVELK